MRNVEGPRSISFGTVAERGLVGMEYEMMDQYAVSGKASDDLPPVALHQDSHRHHECASGVLNYTPSGYALATNPVLVGGGRLVFQSTSSIVEENTTQQF